MDVTFFPTPEDFRKWLAENHDQHNELWVGYYKKATKLPSITWPESVDEALCYGWIDGLRKSIDDKSYKIRFTPRRPNSIWSAVNLKRIKELIAEGRIQKAGMAIYEQRNPEKAEIYAYERKNIKLSKEYAAQIKANPKAWAYFEALPPSAKSLRYGG